MSTFRYVLQLSPTAVWLHSMTITFRIVQGDLKYEVVELIDEHAEWKVHLTFSGVCLLKVNLSADFFPDLQIPHRAIYYVEGARKRHAD
jgi:hypothetical protein